MSNNRGSDGEEEEEEEIMEDGEENISDDDSEQQSVGFDKGASEKTVRRLLRASTAAVHDETVRAKQSRPNTTTGGVLVQTALNFSGSRSCAHSHKMSVEQLDQLQRAARYRLRTDPCKVTGYIIPPLRRVNTDRAATIIFAKTTSRRVKRRVKQAVVDEQSQPNKNEEDDLASGSDDEHPVKSSRTLATNSQQQEEDEQAPAAHRFVHANQQLYLNACKKLNVVPAQYFCKHLVTDAIVMKHHILGEMGIKACCIALTSNSFVKRLDLQDNSIGSEGANYIAEMMQENVHIVDLTVAENDIGTPGMQALSDVLKTHLFLTRLDLSGNHLSDADIKPIIAIIENNSALRHLVLRHNDFATRSAIELSTCLAKNTTLENLDLGWNHFNGQGIAMLCDGITKNKCLTHLNLEWNGLAVEGTKAIARTLRLNKFLVSLDISNNRINTTSLELILKSLKTNLVLQQLHLRGNPIALSGAKLILQTLQQCINLPLNYIDITGQSVDEDFIRTLGVLRQSRPTLQVMYSYVLKENKDTSNVDHFPDDNPVTVFLEFVRLKRCQPHELFTLEADEDTVTYDEFRRALKVNNLVLTMAAAHNLTKLLDSENTGTINVKALSSNLKAHEKRVKARQQDKSVPFEETPLGRVSGRILALLPDLKPVEIEDTNTSKPKKKKNDWMAKMLDDIDINEET